MNSNIEKRKTIILHNVLSKCIRLVFCMMVDIIEETYPKLQYFFITIAFEKNIVQKMI